MAQLHNRAEVSGTFDTMTVDNYTELSVELSALEITKAANKAIWVKDQLEYTITVINIDDRDPEDLDDPGLPVTGVTVEDIIDPTIATLVANSVYIDGSQATQGTDYEFVPGTGLLTVTLGTVDYGTPRVITFLVEMVP